MKIHKGFTAIPRKLLQDKSLSHSARGFLFMALAAQTAGEVITMQWLREETGAGNFAIKRLRDELWRAGYAERIIPAGKNNAQIWKFHDTPVAK